MCNIVDVTNPKHTHGSQLQARTSFLVEMLKEDKTLTVAHSFCALGENPLAFLRTQPQFLHMRQAIQQNPALLPALLQQLGRENPQLLQVPQPVRVLLLLVSVRSFLNSSFFSSPN